MPIVDDVLSRYKGATNAFVETGTFLGDGVRRAMEAGFGAIFSIEINADLVRSNREEFKAYEQVTVVHGDSSRDLGALLARVRSPITYWLDGHYSANPLTGYNPAHISPVLSELDQIRVHRLANPQLGDPTILIDDVRLFRCTSDRLDGYFQLSLDAVLAKLLTICPDYHFSYADGIQKDDILIAHH
jgi:hypothetical protein